MPDITMCMSKNCPKKNECYRSMAKPDKYYQSYAQKMIINTFGKQLFKRKNKSIDMNFRFHRQKSLATVLPKKPRITKDKPCWFLL